MEKSLGKQIRKTPVQWQGIAFYFGLVTALILLVAFAVHSLPGVMGPAAGLSMFTPALSALVVRLVRREGFADAGLRFGYGRWYVFAWALPVGIVVMDFGWLWLLGYARLDLSPERLVAFNPNATVQSYHQAIPGLGVKQTLLVMVLASLTVANIPMIIAGFGEEFGWRSYLLPRLLPLGSWSAFLLVGIIWWAWHLPLGLVSPVKVEINLALAIASGIIGAILYGAVLGWLRYASDSIFPVALAHIAYNNASGAGHILFDVNLDALMVTRIVDVALVCAVITWWGGWKVLPIESGDIENKKFSSMANGKSS